jgi:hypothetical protein
MVTYQTEHIQFDGTRVKTFGKEPNRNITTMPPKKELGQAPILPCLCKTENWEKLALDQRELLRMLAIEQMISLNWETRNLYFLRVFCVYNYICRGLSLKDRAFTLPKVKVPEMDDFLEKFHRSVSIVLDNYPELLKNSPLLANYADVFDGRLYHLCLFKCIKDDSVFTMGDELWDTIMERFPRLNKNNEFYECPLSLEEILLESSDAILEFTPLAIVNNEFLNSVIPGKHIKSYSLKVC